MGIGFLLRMSSYRALSFEGQEVRVVRLGVGGGTVESHCTVYVYGIGIGSGCGALAESVLYLFKRGVGYGVVEGG